MKQIKTFLDTNRIRLEQQINQWLQKEAIEHVGSIAYDWSESGGILASVLYEPSVPKQPTAIQTQYQSYQEELSQVMQSLWELSPRHPNIPALQTRANTLLRCLADLKPRLKAEQEKVPEREKVHAFAEKYQKQIQQIDQALWERPDDLVLLSARAIYLQILQDLEDLDTCHSK